MQKLGASKENTSTITSNKLKEELKKNITALKFAEGSGETKKT